jgi:spermidine synthase/lipoprotein NlpI
MVLELLASRLVARALGSSLHIWTAVAAVVLAGLAIGGVAGGRMADRFHAKRALSVLFALSSAACVAVVIANNAVSDWTWLWRLSWPAHVFFHVCLVFLAPSLLLGAIGPVVAKTALDQGLTPGRTLGAVFAWAAAGSITGILLASFFLVPTFGSTAIVWGIGAAFLAMAVWDWVSCWALYLWAMIFAALAAMGMAPADWARDAGLAAGLREPNDPGVVYEDETAYRYVAVRRVSERPDRRTLWQDQRVRGQAVMGDVTNLQSFQSEVCAGLTQALGRRDAEISVMVIEGGDYTFARYLATVRPDSHVEVVELDPGVTQAATEAFGLPRDTTIRTVNMDARCYLNRLVRDRDDGSPGKSYDLIYMNVVDDYAVPFQWMTTEFNEKVAALLADGGVYLVSLSDTYEGGRFLGAVVHTLKRTFPHVWVIGRRLGPPALPETFVVVATRRDFDPIRVLTEYNEHLVFSVLGDLEMASVKDRCGNVILTDDHAPVENMLAAARRGGACRQLAQRHFLEAAQLQSQGLYDRSIARYRQAAALDPFTVTSAYNAIGAMRSEQGDLKGAADAFEKAIDGYIETGLEPAVLASVHANMGILLQKMGKLTEARSHWAEAAQRFRIELRRNPAAVHVWESLGDVLVLAGELSQAAEAFEKAVALDPENLDDYHKLVNVLEIQKRYDEAIAVARRHLALLKKQGRRDAALEMSQYIDFLEYQKLKR